MGSLFGTDGIRGVANTELSAELALRVGRAVGSACRLDVLGPRRGRPRVVVGRDTRPSGPMLEAALVAGLCSAGADAVRAGIIPTPGVAHLVSALDADAGVVLSASHNPPEDNGIKVFGPGGWKLSPETESRLESLVGAEADRPTGDDVGRAGDLPDALDRYVRHLASGRRLDGVRVVVDCAHGAAWRAAPEALRRLGAEVIALHDSPEGGSINVRCGATHPEVVAEAARRFRCVGLTHDGDADRVLAATEEGRLVDGDAILALLASRMRAEGRLDGDAVVVTVMSNQALRAWAGREGIRLVEVPVGDRNVLEAMRQEGIRLGGEQSGHVILADRATTGDGVLTGIAVLEAVLAGGGRLAPLIPFEPFPQVLVNVRTAGRDGLEGADELWAAVEEEERRLDGRGRVLIRPSGTEPLVRVMVEAQTTDDAREAADRLAAVVERALSAGG